jgi:P27 family predicted phage terminase small subunit
VLRGNPSKRALPTHEAKPAVKLPPAPKHLSVEARREWRRTGKELLRLGLVTTLDRGMFAGYCQAWGRLVEAEEQLRKFGTVIKAPSGFLVQSPYLAIANRALEHMTKIAVEFGMSPSSRSRVHAAAPAEELDPFEQWKRSGGQA